jgi:hypothetical protein
MSEEKELMIVIMHAAADLIQTYNSGLSNSAIRVRMQRIADDLILSAKYTKNDKAFKDG